MTLDAAGPGGRTAAVVYRSRSGTTRRYAEAIGAHLASRGLSVSVASVGEVDMASLATVDLLFLGCWTNGLFVIRQHPDQPWLDFARLLPPNEKAPVVLFTTYTLATGSMFERMRQRLVGRTKAPSLELKSRDGSLSERDRAAIDRFIGRG